MEQVDCCIIGAGVIGLAVARAAAMAGLGVIVLERADAIGTETSARNSEVIHAGLYYPQGSLKARLCVEGRDRLYAYCRARGIGHARIGKLIVASEDGQRPALDAIAAAAVANGVDDLRLLDAAEMCRMEPALAGVAALHSPSTGIVDSHGLMQALQGEAEAHGAMTVLRAAVERIEPRGDGLVLWSDGAPQLLAARVVNAAGLDAVALADGLTREPPLRYAKGNYFLLTGRAPFARLIYPVPEPGGLGVHMTLDLGGQARFGPDVEWIEARDYRVDPARGERFCAAVRRYWPSLPDGALTPGYAGIRPKRAGGDGDFLIETEKAHGVPGLVNLIGIESPGLTASLAIADRVVAQLE